MTYAEYARAVDLMEIIYSSPEGCCGGDLHIILDDQNVRKSDIEYCRGVVNNNPFLSGEFLDAEKELLGILSRMNYLERLSLTQSGYLSDITGLFEFGCLCEYEDFASFDLTGGEK